jgi:hypothetical protein
MLLPSSVRSPKKTTDIFLNFELVTNILRKLKHTPSIPSNKFIAYFRFGVRVAGNERCF